MKTLKQQITKARVFITIIVVLLGCAALYYFFMPTLSLEIPESIVPDQAIRIMPPLGDPLYPSGATSRLWTTEIYAIPNATTEEIIDFYQSRLFRCRQWHRDTGYSAVGETEWICQQNIRKAHLFTVWIPDDPGSEEIVILTEVSIFPLD